MQDNRDEVHVDSDFVISSTNYSILTDGQMFIKGNFMEVSQGGCFQATEKHTVILNGLGTQNVTFNSSDRFAILQITQPLNSYTFNPGMCWEKMFQLVFGEADFVLPTGLTKIEEYAFEGVGATVVSLPISCREIDMFAFKDSSVIQIRIPADCTIGMDVFDGCQNVVIFSGAESPAKEYCNNHDNCFFVEE